MFDLIDKPVPDMDQLDDGNKWVNFQKNEPQGIAHVGNDWFLVSFQQSIEWLSMSRNEPQHYRRELGVDFDGLNQLFAGKMVNGRPIIFDGDHYRHIGDIDYFGGLMFVPVEHSDYKNLEAKPLLVGLTTDFELVGYALLGGKTRIEVVPDTRSEVPDYSAACCAVHRWNRSLLYVPSECDCDIDDAGRGSRLFAYDISSFYEARGDMGRELEAPLLPEKTLYLYKEDGTPDVLGAGDTPELHRGGVQVPPKERCVQGVAISINGRIYVTEGFGKGHKNWLTIYDGFTRRRYGTRCYNFDGIGDELEGLTVDEQTGSVFIVVNDNTANLPLVGNVGTDWCDIYRYTYPGFAP
ncbi:MAG: hypothetical protein AB7Q42_10445 [Acidimicrobiia bacterium]